jgi:hypothetical protein
MASMDWNCFESEICANVDEFLLPSINGEKQILDWSALKIDVISHGVELR